MKQYPDRVWKIALVVLVLGISLLFFAMIHQFWKTLLMAAIFSGLVYPFYRRLAVVLKGHRGIASFLTILLTLLVIVIPLISILTIAANQAINVTETAAPWVEKQIQQTSDIESVINNLPFGERLLPYREKIISTLGALAQGAGNFLIDSASAATRGTIKFFFHLFLMLYTMFFFLVDGPKLLNKMLFYLPLQTETELRLVDRFVSVTRATLKGTFIIGVVQGVLAATAMAMAGVPGSVFWGVLMVVLSVIPGIGAGLVWVPAAAYVFIVGNTTTGILLTIWCALIVSSADNFLRPKLVGKDTQMHEVLILFSTLGGIFLFGITGFIIGPIVAAVFVTAWEIYGEAFGEILPPTT